MKLKVAGYTGKGTKYYDCENVQKLIEWLEKAGYECESLHEGVLGMGTFIMWSPEPETQYSFLVREIALNCWSSGHTIQRFSRVTKALQAEIDAARAEILEELA